MSLPQCPYDRLPVDGVGDGQSHATVGQDRVPEIEPEIGRVAPGCFLHHQVSAFEGGGDQVGIHSVQDEVDAPFLELEEPHVAVGEKLDHHPLDPRSPAIVSLVPGKPDGGVLLEVVHPVGSCPYRGGVPRGP